MGKKIISFVVYGSNPRYTYNIIINCLLRDKIYPSWIIRIYYDDTCPNTIIKILETFSDVELVKMPLHTGEDVRTWRFLPLKENDVDILLSRDADSWISMREKNMVDDFINSDKQFHIIRDHCQHNFSHILAGMWGCKKGLLNNIEDLLTDFEKRFSIYKKHQSYDQIFLQNIIYPLVIDKALIHHYKYQNTRQNIFLQNEKSIHFEKNGNEIYTLTINNHDFIIDFEETSKLNLFPCGVCSYNQHILYIGEQLIKLPENLIKIIEDLKCQFS